MSTYMTCPDILKLLNMFEDEIVHATNNKQSTHHNTKINCPPNKELHLHTQFNSEKAAR